MLLVIFECCGQGFLDLLSQLCGGNHFHIRAVFEDIHHQFGRVAVGDLQLVAAVAEIFPLLERMPLLVGDPAGPSGGEFEHGGVARLAGKDAIGLAEVLAEGVGAEVFRCFAAVSEVADAVEGEAAQGLPLVAPGVEVPVVPIVHQPLRREGAAGLFVVAPAAVVDGDALALQQGAGDALKVLCGHRAGGVGEDAHPLGDIPTAHLLQFEDLLDTLLQRVQVAFQQAWLHVGQQLLGDEQGVKLGGVEPEPWQMVGVVPLAVIEVAVAFAVILDGGTEVVAQIFDGSLDGGFGALQLLFQRGSGDGVAALVEQVVEDVDASETVHVSFSCVRSQKSPHFWLKKAGLGLWR